MPNTPNPYAAPEVPPPPPAPKTKEKEPFSHQAAKFSLYAPFILMLLGFVMRSVLGRGEQAEQHLQDGSTLQVESAIAIIQLLTTLAAFGLGFVGLVGGILRRKGWTIAIAIGGILLNGLILTFVVSVLLIVLGRH